MLKIVTVHAKTSLIRTKIEIHFYKPSSLHSMSPMHGHTQLICFSGGRIYSLVKAVKSYDRHIAGYTCGARPIGCNQPGIRSFYPRPQWCPFGLVASLVGWSGPSGGPVSSPGSFCHLPASHPPTPPRLPPTPL